MNACSFAALVVLAPEELIVDGWNVIWGEELLVVTTGRVVLEEIDVEPPPGLTVIVPSGPEQLGAPLLLVTQVSPVAAEIFVSVQLKLVCGGWRRTTAIASSWTGIVSWKRASCRSTRASLSDRATAFLSIRDNTIISVVCN